MTGRSLEKRAKILGLTDVTTIESYSRLRPDHFTDEHFKPVHWRKPVRLVPLRPRGPGSAMKTVT